MLLAFSPSEGYQPCVVASTLPLLLGIYLELISVLARPFILYSYTKQQSELPKSIKVKSHGNNVHGVFVVHVRSGDAQTNRQTDVETIKTSWQHVKHVAGW